MNPDNQQNDNIEISESEPDVFIRKSKNSKYIIEYRKDMCIGAASCAAIAPFTFEMNDEENLAELIVSDEEDDDDVILAAAQSCPVFAIIVKNAETGEQIFPPLE